MNAEKNKKQGLDAERDVLSHEASVPADSSKDAPWKLKATYDNISLILGVFSAVPFIGFFTGIAAVLFGILALVFPGKNPQKYSKLKVWLGILFGGIFFLVHSNVIFNTLLIMQSAENGR